MSKSSHQELQKAYNALKQSELRSDKLLNNLSIGVGYYDLEGKIIKLNSKAAEYMGGKPEDFTGKTMYDLFGKKFGEIYFKRLQDSLKCDDHLEFMDEVDLPGGKKWFISQYFPIRGKGDKLSGVQIVLTDITHYKSVENELSNAKNKAKRYRDLSDNIILALDRLGMITMINETGLRILGYKKQKDLIGKNWFTTCLPPHRKAHVEKEFKEILNNKIDTNRYIEDLILTKSGKERPIYWYNTVIRDDEDNIIGTLSSGTDITESHKAQEAIRESEEKFRFAMEASRDGIWDWDIKNNSIFYSKGWKNILNIKEVEPVLDTWEKRLHPEDKDEVLKSLQEHLEGKTEYWIKEHRLLKNNEWLWVRGRGQVVKRDKKGKALRMVGTMTDIHERMISRNELIRQKNLLDNVIMKSPLPTWISDAKGKVLIANPALLDTLNLKEEEVVGVYNILNDKNIREAGHMPLVYEVFEKQHIVKFTLFWEKQFSGIPSNEGRHDVYVDATLFPISGENNELKYVVCQWMDISEQKKIEQEIKESRERYRALYENAPLCYQSLNIDGYFNDVNPIWLTTLGYERDEVIGKSFSDFLHPDYKKHFEINFPAFKERGYVHDVQFKLRHKKGHYLDVSFEGCIGYDTSGKMKQTYCVFKDITQEVKATIALKESEEKYRFLVENQNDLIVKFDPKKNTILFASPNYLNVFGKNKDEVINQSFFSLIHKDDLDLARASITSLYAPPHTSYHEERAMTVNGWRWFGWSLNASVNDKNEITETVAVGRDITEQKRAESQVEQLSRFPSENPNPVLRISQKGKILYSNTAAKSVMDMIAHNNMKYVNPQWRDIILRSLKTQTTDLHELIVKDKIYNVNIAPVKEHAYVNLYLNDITEEKRAESEKRISENRYAELVNTINSGVAIYKVINDGSSGDDYIIQDFNKLALEHEQLSKEEVIGKSLKDIRPNIDDYGLIDIFKKVWKSGKPAFYPAKIYTDEKFANYYENRIFRLPNHEIVAIYDDVSEREKAINKIKESEERFELAMKATSDGVFDWDLISNEIYYSPGWKSMLGYEYDELPNDFSVWETLTYPEDVKRSWDALDKVVKGELDRFEIEFKMKHKNGHWVDILSRATAIFDEKGKAYRMIGTHVDISATKQFEKKLTEALNKAKESDRLKSAFLANMSHEIRTPMNGILGFSNLLKQADVGFEKRKEYIDIIQQSGKRMMNTINDLIDISRIESGQIEFNGSYINLNSKIRELYNFFRLDTQSKGLELSYSNGLDDDKAQIFSDALKIYAILSNFLNNAIKFTSSGSIKFGYLLKDELIEFFVRDTGRGIHPDSIEHIFDRFIQAELDLSRGYERSGLGLSISKAYAEVLRGDIRVESEPGKGSTFYLTIPFTQKAVLLENKKEMENGILLKENDFSKINLLIVEDDEASILYLETLLSEQFNKILTSSNGRDAIEMVKTHPEINLILMDIKMPLLDGISATKEIRKFNRHIKIIAQTAYAMESDNEKTIQAGCDGYVSKPIDEDKLFALINKVFK